MYLKLHLVGGGRVMRVDGSNVVRILPAEVKDVIERGEFFTCIRMQRLHQLVSNPANL